MRRGGSKEPTRGRGEQGHTLTLARPFRRRAARIARPALVRMRSRKPCVLARRRLFGWNVRLLTGGSTYGFITGSPAARRASARQTARESVGSVHGMRTSNHRSNQWCCATEPADSTGRGKGRLLNAKWPASLGCGQLASRAGAGRCGPTSQRSSGVRQLPGVRRAQPVDKTVDSHVGAKVNTR